MKLYLGIKREVLIKQSNGKMEEEQKAVTEEGNKRGNPIGEGKRNIPQNKERERERENKGHSVVAVTTSLVGSLTPAGHSGNIKLGSAVSP